MEIRIRYHSGGLSLAGTLFTEAPEERRPLVLVGHTGLGPGEFERGRAAALAASGYAAFALDLYGGDLSPYSPRRAIEQANALLARRTELRARAVAALHAVRGLPCVDGERVAAIGYCLGGTAAIELARAGESVRAAVTIHGTLAAPHGPSPRRVSARILALLGADDPFIAPAEIEAFEDEMRRLKVDYWIVRFGGAVHGFAEPRRGTARESGMAYDADADRRAWRVLLGFLEETLGPN